ncbi:IS1182 family transposase [Sphaerisporangium sp. NPDC051011]|uniref:IS1182 family transposase n=1 Tax=Sphaerisporangium sp. NPDC051011 TaxID=3155792 RepID=UPI0033E0EC5D
MSMRPESFMQIPEATRRVAAAAFPKGTMCMRLRDALGRLFSDEEFADLYPGDGQPAQSPGRLALAVVLQYAEGLSDRQAADAVRGRLDWKYALAMELEDPGFDFSVFSEFRDRVIGGSAEERVLELLLERLWQARLLRAGGRARTDSTHVLSAARTLNRLELVVEAMRAALNALAVAAPSWLSPLIGQEWCERYDQRADSYRLPKGEQARADYASVVGGDGYVLLEAVYHVDSPLWLRQVEAVQTLRLCWIQQYYRDHDGVRLREQKDLPVGRDRLASPYDTDARYAVKRGSGWTGYKVHLTETCEPDRPHLVTHVATTPAPVDDSEVTLLVQESLERRGVLPDEHAVDSAYVSAEHIVTARDRFGIELLGPVSADTSWQTKDGDAFQTADFLVNWDEGQVTCPQGHTSLSMAAQRSGTGHPVIKVNFSQAHCTPCPVRAQCTKSATASRKLTLRPREQHQALAHARALQRTEQWQRRYQVRAGAEGTISQAVRGHGQRRSRYIGLAKTHLQSVLTATAINLVRVDAWLTETPLGRTRTSRFIRLRQTITA